MKHDMHGYVLQANLIRAMAHPTRLRILEILTQGECCVCHLIAILKLRQPCVSQHLMVLRQAGLVSVRKEGVQVYYRLVDSRIAVAIALTRDLLRANASTLSFEPIPSPPIRGCTCPRCVNQLS
jgi:ArsR family transcriptional regulator